MNTTSTTLSDAEQRGLVMLGQRVRQLRQQHGVSINVCAIAVLDGGVCCDGLSLTHRTEHRSRPCYR